MDSTCYIQDLEKEKSTLQKKIKALERCKDAVEVKLVTEEFDDTSEQEKFDSLIEGVSKELSNFYGEIQRFIVFNHFGKPYEPDFSNYSDEYDMGIRNNILLTDGEGVNWSNRKVLRLVNALNDLSNEMNGEFSESFVESYEEKHDEEFEVDNGEFLSRHFGI